MLRTPAVSIKKTTFYLGADRYGRDLLGQGRMIIGSRISFTIGFVAVLIAIAIGVSLGAIAGYFGGKIDAVIMWLINIMWSIPTLLMVIAVTFALGKGVWQVYVAVGLTMWVEVARMVRGQVISAKQMQYVEAARALGFGEDGGQRHRISLSQYLGSGDSDNGIEFRLGHTYGKRTGFPRSRRTTAYTFVGRDTYATTTCIWSSANSYLAVVPGTMIMLLVLAFMTFGNTLRDAFDVRVIKMLGKDRTRKHSFCSHFWCE